MDKNVSLVTKVFVFFKQTLSKKLEYSIASVSEYVDIYKRISMYTRNPEIRWMLIDDKSSLQQNKP